MEAIHSKELEIAILTEAIDRQNLKRLRIKR